VRHLGHSLSYEESIRILLNGLTNCNVNQVCRESGVCRQYIKDFLLSKETETIYPKQIKAREKLERFVWNKLNSSILLSDEDRM